MPRGRPVAARPTTTPIPTPRRRPRRTLAAPARRRARSPAPRRRRPRPSTSPRDRRRRGRRRRPPSRAATGAAIRVGVAVRSRRRDPRRRRRAPSQAPTPRRHGAPRADDGGAGVPASASAAARRIRSPAGCSSAGGRSPRASRTRAAHRRELVAVPSPRALVSGTHLELRLEGSRLVATDLKSTNGTIVRSPSGSRRMRAGESIVVGSGHQPRPRRRYDHRDPPGPRRFPPNDPDQTAGSPVTQIGNGNARHRVPLPDGTEVTIAWAAMTDTGLRREVNEDSFVAQAPIFAVADGMGGHAAGDFASAAVVTRLAEHGGKVVMGTPEIDARPAPRRAGHGPRRGRHRRGQRHHGHRGRARSDLRRAGVDRLQHRRLAGVPARRRRARAAHRRPLDRAGARRRRARSRARRPTRIRTPT